MSFNPTDFLKIADSLLKDKKYDNAAVYRTVIGRAYYGCFLYTRNNLGLQNWQPRKGGKKGDIHYIVIMTLKSKDQKKGDFLWSLRNKRNKADYDLNLAINKNDAIYALTLARKITV